MLHYLAVLPRSLYGQVRRKYFKFKICSVALILKLLLLKYTIPMSFTSDPGVHFTHRVCAVKEKRTTLLDTRIIVARTYSLD
jgi:hypothetical protein